MNQAARKQIDVEPIPLLEIVCHEWFKAGFIEASKGSPFHFFCYGDSDERDKWFYERGRMVAAEARSTYGRVPQLWVAADDCVVINPQIISLAGAMIMTGAFA